MRDDVLDRLQRGEDVLRKTGLREETSAVPGSFADRSVTVDVILQLTKLKYLRAAAAGEYYATLEFWTGDTLSRIGSSGSDTEFGAKRFVYLQNETHALIFTVILEEDPLPLLQRLLGRPTTGTWRLYCKGRRFHAHGDEDWHVIAFEPRQQPGRPFPDDFQPLLAIGWNTLLDRISTYDHAATLIDPKEIRRLLALPVVEPYDDFWGDSCGFWYGQLFCAFRQEGALYDTEPQPALLRISREYTHADGRDLIEGYFFTLRQQADGTECVFITYKDDEGSDAAHLLISFEGGRHLERARRIFNAARRNLDQANCELLEYGIPPNCKDDFAITHWRKQGFISRPGPSEFDEEFAPGAEEAVQPASGLRSRAVE